ncbi:response regulator [uncultured Pontibacter sp.]|uniref:response regulator n=1 Tax=uncultured Pontibacter sp. TaxID=453356 RepID=UPI00262F9587|nr:response regulator [uncultured Pontibacter sp.]
MFKSVYIIDDDEVSAFLTEAMLTAEDFAESYQTFLNPCDALQQILPYLLETKPDQLPEIIILDLNMPYMNGWEFLDALEPYAYLLENYCLIYMLTSSVDVKDIRRAQEYDFLAGFLQKPIEEDIIRKILNET